MLFVVSVQVTLQFLVYLIDLLRLNAGMALSVDYMQTAFGRHNYAVRIQE